MSLLFLASAAAAFVAFLILVFSNWWVIVLSGAGLLFMLAVLSDVDIVGSRPVNIIRRGQQ